jgi:chromosome segregation ATPase
MNEVQKDIAFSQGLLEGWTEQAPFQIKQALIKLIEGISYYKNEVYAEKRNMLEQSAKVTNSATQLSDLLGTIQHQVDQIAELEEDLRQAQERIQTLENNLEQQRSNIRRRTNPGFVEV